VKVCPVEVPDSFNAGLTARKVIYLPIPHAVPNAYVIDTIVCSRCGDCEAICPTGAIKISEEIRKDFRILVVDDELIMRDSLKAWLEDEGFTVDTAPSGPEALDLLSKQVYQLMLADIVMPGMDGVELLQQAKETFSDLYVVMMTASSAPPALSLATRASLMAYMQQMDEQKSASI